MASSRTISVHSFVAPPRPAPLTKQEVVSAARKAYPDGLGTALESDDPRIPTAVRQQLALVLPSLQADFGDADVYQLDVGGRPVYWALGIGDDSDGGVVFDARGKTVASGTSDLTPEDAEFWKTPYVTSAPLPPPPANSLDAVSAAVAKIPGVLGVDIYGAQVVVGLEHNTEQLRAQINKLVQTQRPGTEVAFMGARRWNYQHE